MKTPLCLSVVLFMLAGMGQAQSPQPSGPSLDFTMNYLNNALDSGGSLSLNGTKLTYAYDSDPWEYTYKIELVGAQARHGAYDSIITLGCPDGGAISCVHEKGCNDYTGKCFSNPLPVFFYIKEKNNGFKRQDFINALNHLISLVAAQQNADREQQRQQNQSDPFATPQK